MQDVHISSGLKWTLLAAAAVLVALLVFHAGVALGERHALGSLRPRTAQGPGMGMPHGFLPDGHGAVGTIESVSLPAFALRERDGTEETVSLEASTTIEEGTQTLGSSSLKAGQSVVVIGMPTGSASQMQAELVRIVP